MRQSFAKKNSACTKGGFFSESAICFSNLPISKYISKNYPELEIQNSRPYQNTFMAGNFKFQVQDSFWNIDIEFYDSLIKIDKTSYLSEEGILQAEHVVKFYDL